MLLEAQKTLQPSSQQDIQTPRSTASIAVGTGETGQGRCRVWVSADLHTVSLLIMLFAPFCIQVPVSSGSSQTSASFMRKYRVLPRSPHPHPPPIPPPAILSAPLTGLSSNLRLKLRIVSRVRFLPAPPPGSTGEMFHQV